MNDIAGNLAAVLQAVESASLAAGRSPAGVRLVAVSKTFPAAAIRAAAAGQRAFGENYLQEALDKIGDLQDLGLEWHFIGPVQSNKTRDLAAHFDWVHGIERLKIAERLSAQRPEDLPPLDLCVQVNVSGEASKSGCAPGEAAALCAAIATLPRLRLRGLMAIPEAVESAEEARPAFRALRELHARIRAAGLVDPERFDTLSMGMSGDFRVAIEEGATLVRVGSAIFGSRDRGPGTRDPGTAI
ncbi:MAG TPA: YggS family pyridoxal phosphate-dependent enzyme [Nevskia sp.]|jgi:pyridoxal phosphate enzyme (YggS family)|nr:YggS family pyridoxal phosphate-dependent enzyme [Nevskia sp.]